MAKTYKELDVYRISFDLFIRTHRFTFRMPKHETYELGSQLRRSADSVNSNIVEGYGRKRYKNDFIKFLVYSHASNDETINHLRKIEKLYLELSEEANQLIKEYDLLGGKLNKFIEYVINNWKT
ncbi:MAG: four helix bundle protein [Saprospiraceae bacterium]